MVEIEKKDLEYKIFKEKLSYEDIGKIYGCTGGYIRKYAKKIGIELPQRRSKSDTETFNKGKNSNICPVCGKEIPSWRKFCSKNCSKEYKHKEYISNWNNGKENGVSGNYFVSKHIRSYLFEKNNCKCEKCGWGEVNEYTGKVPLQIHHIDGDCTNNKEENLQLLCPNCHSLTENFGSRNKFATKGRTDYFLQK